MQSYLIYKHVTMCCIYNRPEGFWDTMYSDMGAEEFVHSSALGVLILWFAW